MKVRDFVKLLIDHPELADLDLKVGEGLSDHVIGVERTDVPAYGRWSDARPYVEIVTGKKE